MLTLREAGWRVHRNFLYCFCNFSVGLTLFFLISLLWSVSGRIAHFQRMHFEGEQFPKAHLFQCEGLLIHKGFSVLFSVKNDKTHRQMTSLTRGFHSVKCPNLSGGDWNLLLSELLGNYLTQSSQHALTEDDAVGTENMEEVCSLSWSRGPCTWQHCPGLFVSSIQVVIPRPVFGTWMSPDLCLASLASGWFGITY